MTSFFYNFFRHTPLFFFSFIHISQLILHVLCVNTNYKLDENKGGYMEKRYMISDAAKLIDVEAHVLRYWEDELDITIPRNEMGHRYYTDEIISLFKKVKDLKDQGFLLKAIKLILPEIQNNDEIVTQVKNESTINSEDKMVQFQQILGNIITKAMEDNNAALSHCVSMQVSEKVIKQMDYLLRLREEHEDERFKRLDESIRLIQQNNKNKASSKKGFGLLSKRKNCPT